VFSFAILVFFCGNNFHVRIAGSTQRRKDAEAQRGKGLKTVEQKQTKLTKEEFSFIAFVICGNSKFI